MLTALLAGLICSAAVCSAAETNVITSAQKISGGTWVKNQKGKRYLKKNGTYVRRAWIKVGKYVYYVGANRYCRTGWFTYGGRKYYAGNNGRVYYNKWLTRGIRTYYFGADGLAKASGWTQIDGKYYYFKKNGVMAVNRLIGSYFVDRSGVRVTSVWVKKNGKYYYFGPNGRRLREKWLRSGSKYYYFDANGELVTDQWINNKYYVGSNGARKVNCVVDGYYLNEKGEKTIKIFEGKYIFVGDSRTVGMQNAVTSADAMFIGKVSSGFLWLSAEAGPLLENYLKANPNVKVIFAHGVNDLGNVDSYVKYYSDLIEEYPVTQFYFLAVNPVDETRWSSVKNASIEAFNKVIRAAFRPNYVNTYSYLVKKGFGTADGLHYDAETYQKLYNYICKKIG